MGSLEEGARNAVETCMSIKPDEHVLIVTDKSQFEVGHSIYEASRKITPYVEMHVLEDYGESLIHELPKGITEAVDRANATFWVTSGYHTIELENSFVDFSMKCSKRRHAHMAGITRLQMEEGMCVDYHDVERFTDSLYNIVLGSKEIKIESEASNKKRTKLSIEITPAWKWVKSPGIIKSGEWDNLPGGEVFTAPYRANGTVVTNLLGDYFDAKYGILDPPLYFEIEDSRILLDTIDCRRNLNEELSAYLKKEENSNRASEIGLPANHRLIPKPISGNLLQDEKARVHIAFGGTYPKETGADWDAETHIDCILEGCDVSVDGRQLMKLGRYLFEVF